MNYFPDTTNPPISQFISYPPPHIYSVGFSSFPLKQHYARRAPRAFGLAADVLDPDGIVSKGAAANWIRYENNDDSSEMPANPSGSKYNSLMRVVSEPSDPLKALIRGLYRISFTTYKVGEVQGSFLAQIGAPVNLPGVVVGASLEEVAAKANQ